MLTDEVLAPVARRPFDGALSTVRGQGRPRRLQGTQRRQEDGSRKGSPGRTEAQGQSDRVDLCSLVPIAFPALTMSAPRQIIHFEEKARILTLKDLCIELIAKNVDDVDSLGDIGGQSRRSLMPRVPKPEFVHRESRG